uniref:hypothetical protein n=1 Tax=Paenibacillus xylanexedens TaxID=528191 RepID=UPI001C92E86F
LHHFSFLSSSLILVFLFSLSPSTHTSHANTTISYDNHSLPYPNNMFLLYPPPQPSIISLL